MSCYLSRNCTTLFRLLLVRRLSDLLRIAACGCNRPLPVVTMKLVQFESKAINTLARCVARIYEICPYGGKSADDSCRAV
jgi:hypothetical protein